MEIIEISPISFVQQTLYIGNRNFSIFIQKFAKQSHQKAVESHRNSKA